MKDLFKKLAVGSTAALGVVAGSANAALSTEVTTAAATAAADTTEAGGLMIVVAIAAAAAGWVISVII